MQKVDLQTSPHLCLQGKLRDSHAVRGSPPAAAGCQLENLEASGPGCIMHPAVAQASPEQSQMHPGVCVLTHVRMCVSRSQPPTTSHTTSRMSSDHSTNLSPQASTGEHCSLDHQPLQFHMATWQALTTRHDHMTGPVRLPTTVGLGLVRLPTMTPCCTCQFRDVTACLDLARLQPPGQHQ